ncbi:MAG: ROK family protein [Lachnospiraceae bacterium]|nr:ROK family protein [Lachnospiraceae bacterium]
MEKDKGYVIGIDAGGTKVAYGLFGEDGEMTDRVQHPSDLELDGPAFSDRLILTIRELLEKNDLSIQNLKGVGICMPSYILFDKGYIFLTSALPKVCDFGMRDYIEERLGVRVVLDNDGNAAALAEYRRGAGRGLKHMVYVAVSTGIGSGLIINGELFRGSYGWAGECGHMLATPDEGVLCGCRNRGCFMSYASGRYVPRHLKIRMLEGEKSEMEGITDLRCEHLLAAAQRKDPLAEEMVQSMAHYIGVCLYNIYQLLNINTFVLGGGLTNFGNLLFDQVRAEFDSYDKIGMPVEFRFAELKKDFGIIGAAELVL